MTSYVGIDPGLDGFIARIEWKWTANQKPKPESGQWLDSYFQPSVSLFPIPTLATGRGSKRLYDRHGLWMLVQEVVKDAELVELERQGAMPGQGVSACWSGGFGYGLLCMALTAAKAPTEEVMPAVWKRSVGVLVPADGSDKAARKKQGKALAIQKAQGLYPGVDLRASERSRVPSPDAAEALLLAHYALTRTRKSE